MFDMLYGREPKLNKKPEKQRRPVGSHPFKQCKTAAEESVNVHAETVVNLVFLTEDVD